MLTALIIVMGIVALIIDAIRDGGECTEIIIFAGVIALFMGLVEIPFAIMFLLERI